MLIRAFICSLIAGSLAGAAEKPQFETYPPIRSFEGKPARPRFATLGQRQFRTIIEDAVKQGPNFAGHFRLVEWGCGTGCLSIAVVDVASGLVYDGPFGRLPRGSIYLGPPPDPDTTGLSFRPESRLLIAAGCPNWDKCGEYYYDWTGNRFKLILRTAIRADGR